MVSTFSTWIFISVKNFGPPFKTFCLFRTFSGRSSQNCRYNFHSDWNFRNIWLNDKQPMQPGPRAGNHTKRLITDWSKKASLLWLVICCTIFFEPITEHIVKKSDNNEVWSFLCWIPLSNSSCKVLSMNFTAESHCCFSLTDQSSSAVSWITLCEVQNRAVTYYTETDSRTVSNRDTFRCFRFLFLDWPKTKLL